MSAVAIVQPDPSGAIAVSVTRFGIAGAGGSFQDKVTGDPANPDAAYAQAIDHIADRFQQDWIAQNQVSSSVEQRLTVEAADQRSCAMGRTAPAADAAVTTLHQVDVVYLMQNHAEIDLVFVGDRDQLARALQQRALLLKDTATGIPRWKWPARSRERMSGRGQLAFWLIGFALFLLALYLLRGILLPFVAGMAVAYMLDPICDWLETPWLFAQLGDGNRQHRLCVPSSSWHCWCWCRCWSVSCSISPGGCRVM